MANEIWSTTPPIAPHSHTGRSSFYVAYSDDTTLIRRIASWKGCHLRATYFHPDNRITYDVFLPARYYNKVAKLLELPPRTRSSKQKIQTEEIIRVGRPTRYKETPSKRAKSSPISTVCPPPPPNKGHTPSSPSATP